MRLVVLAGLALTLPGCLVNFDETTFIKVHHPADVSVGVQSPSGGEWILPANGPVETKELPDSNPPLTEGRKYATVARRAGGTVTLDCPSCLNAKHAEVVGYANEITLNGSVEQTLTWDSDPKRLGMRYSHLASFPCYRHPSHACPREAVALWLSTPQENLVEVRHVKTVQKANGERFGAWMGTVVGSVFFGAGTALGVGFGFDDNAHARAPVLCLSGTFMAIGGFFVVAGLQGLLAKDSDTILYRAPVSQ